MFNEIYEKIKNCSYPLYIWGNGSMAHVVYNRLCEHNIKVYGFFEDVHSDFKEQHNNDEIYCYELNYLLNHKKEFSVVIGHGHIELVKKIKSYSMIKNIFIIPNPYLQYIPDESIVSKALSKDIDEINNVLLDEESRVNIRKYFELYNGNIESFYENTKILQSIFKPDVYSLSAHEVFYDIGAWNGDTIEEFTNIVNNKYKIIEAFEPVIAKDSKLRIMARNNKIILNSIALGNSSGFVELSNENTQSAFMRKTDNASITMHRLDDLVVNKEKPTLIKICVPMMTLDVLRGAEKTIKKYNPKLIVNVSIGINNDMIDTIRWINRCNENYSIVLRYRLYMPTQLWLYAF